MPRTTRLACPQATCICDTHLAKQVYCCLVRLATICVYAPTSRTSQFLQVRDPATHQTTTISKTAGVRGQTLKPPETDSEPEKRGLPRSLKHFLGEARRVSSTGVTSIWQGIRSINADPVDWFVGFLSDVG
jgi:hypothetical protein